MDEERYDTNGIRYDKRRARFYYFYIIILL